MEVNSQLCIHAGLKNLHIKLYMSVSLSIFHRHYDLKLCQIFPKSITRPAFFPIIFFIICILILVLISLSALRVVIPGDVLKSDSHISDF